MSSGSLARLIVLAVTLLLPALPALADTTINLDATCTLAQAIKSANGLTGQTNIGGCEDGTEPSSGEDGRDTIDLGGNTIRLTANLPFITSKVKIIGNANHVTGENKYEIFTITNGADVEINNLKIEFGRSATNGGGISVTGSSVTLNNVRMQGNTAARGGAIYANSASVTINRGVFLDNVAQNGGAIYADMSGSASIRTSLTNVMVYHNTASGAGGGIYITGSNANARTDLRYVTMTRNTATGGNGGGIYNDKRRLNVRRSIIYGNSGSDCKLAGSPTIAFTQNFIDSDSDAACKTSQNTNDPLLAPTDYEGDPIRLHYQLYVGSPALNAADPSESGRTNCWSNTVDVFGTTRPVGTGCDIGAYEGAGVALPTATPTATPTITPTPTPTATATATATQVQNALIQNNPTATATATRPSGQRPLVQQSVAGQPPDDEDDEDPPERALVAFPTWTTTPHFRYSPAQSCLTLQPFIVVNNASSGTSCQRVQGMQIGHPDLVAANPSAVVDIWGWVTPNTEVCFWASSGSIKFIDTAALPRTVADLPVHNQPGGLLCAIINGAGQVALVAGPPAPFASATPPAYRSLSGCMVRTQYILNLRGSPGGETLLHVPFDVTLTALEWTAGWFKVDYLGEHGWIAGEYVEPAGDCG